MDGETTKSRFRQMSPYQRRLIAIFGAALAALMFIAVFMAGRSVGKAEAVPAERPEVGLDGRIGYATAGVVALDEQTLQEAVDEMYQKAKEPGIALEYKNVLVSDDGVNFECYLGNSADNAYDMFFTIYGDQALTEEWYLSELLRPGTAFETVAFQTKLEPGEYTAYLVHTQVDDEEQDGSSAMTTQVMHAQIATTITLYVNPY